MMRPGLLAIVVLALLVTSTRALSEELDYGRLIERTANSIDDLLTDEDRSMISVDGRGRKRREKLRPLDRSKLVPTISFMLNMQEPMLTKAFVQNRHRLSDILFARHLAEKGSRPFELVLKKRSVSEWVDEMEEAKIPLDKVLETFDQVFAQIAAKSLDDDMRLK